MLREFGSPTFFLTLSYAEYDSPEMELSQKVNTVNGSYPIAKLCAEDPLSVSRKFSQKFHDFFKMVILYIYIQLLQLHLKCVVLMHFY